MTKKEITKQQIQPQQDRPLENSEEKNAEEIGGPKGPEPTRYGDWEKKGRCVDF